MRTRLPARRLQLLSTWLEFRSSGSRERVLRAWVRWDPFPSRSAARAALVRTLLTRPQRFGIVLTITLAVRRQRRESLRRNGATLFSLRRGFVFRTLPIGLHSTGLARAWRWLPRVVVWVIWLAAAAGLVDSLRPLPYHAGARRRWGKRGGECAPSSRDSCDISVIEGMWASRPATGRPACPVQERNLYAAEAQLAESKARQSRWSPAAARRKSTGALRRPDGRGAVGVEHRRAERAKPRSIKKHHVQEYEPAIQTK